MIKIAGAAALSAFIVCGAPVTSAFTGTAATPEQPRAVKGDRLPSAPAATGCARAWPYYQGDCVYRIAPSGRTPELRQVRIVSADRLLVRSTAN